MSPDEVRSPLGRCVGFEDGADGFVIHAEDCSLSGHSWVSGSDCIEYGTWQGAWPDWVKAPVVDDPTVGWPNSQVWWNASPHGGAE